MDTAPQICPRCSGELQLLPPMKHTGFLAYVGGELTFWIVAALVGGVISTVANQMYVLSYILGGIAAAGVFVLIHRAGERASLEPGLFYCKKCQFYRRPDRLEGENGAI